MSKIPCPSCGEINFEKSPRCWKCGCQLTQQKHDTAPAIPNPESDFSGEDIRVDTEQKPSAIMESVIAMETEDPTRRKNLLLAVIATAVLTAVLSLIFNIPFYRWLHAISLPVSAGRGYIIWSILAAGTAGAYSAYHRKGIAGGVIIYTALLLLFRFYALFTCAIVPPKVAPLFIIDYHQLVSPILIGSGMAGSWFILRKLGRKPQYPSLSTQDFLRKHISTMQVMAAVLALCLLISYISYKSAIRRAADDPRRVIGGYYWMICKGSDVPSSIRYLLTDSLAIRSKMEKDISKALYPSYKSPHMRAAKMIVLGKIDLPVSYDAERSEAKVKINILPDGSWLPEVWRMPEELETITVVEFTLQCEAGRWRISEPPVATYKGL